MKHDREAEKLTDALLAAPRQPHPDPTTRWQQDLMRAVRCLKPQAHAPLTLFDQIAWRAAPVLVALSLLFFAWSVLSVSGISGQIAALAFFEPAEYASLQVCGF